MRIFFFCLDLSLGLAGCSSSSSRGGYFENDGPPSAVGHLKALGSNDITIRVEQPHKWANRPYTVLGKRYVPVTGDKPMTQVGEASWYGKQFHGKKTSMGEIYDMYALTAAHKTMQLPSYARVTNLKNGRSIIVRVNDRGPFVDDRIIDLSYAAAVQLGYQNQGVTRVRVERITMKDIAAGRIPSTNASDTTVASAAPGGWTVQLGAFGVKDNAAAAAAHAEMMFSQQQRAFGSVRVVDTGSVFRVVVGSVASQPEAIALARSVSSALGSSAFAIAEPAPAR